MSSVKDFLKRKDIVITPQRYLIEALGAMAQEITLRSDNDILPLQKVLYT